VVNPGGTIVLVAECRKGIGKFGVTLKTADSVDTVIRNFYQQGLDRWRKVLDKGPEIGAVDLALEPENPKAIYATVWNAHRPPWSVYGPLEGPGSGLYKSTDAGDHWTQIAGHGLPEGDWRRSGLATAAGGRVYVLIDALSGGGMFRSDDAGQTWTRASADTRIVSRGWYFGGVTADAPAGSTPTMSAIGWCRPATC